MSNFTQAFKSFKQTGAAILQVMLAAVAIAGTSVYLLRSKDITSNLQNKLKYNQDITQISEHIQSVLARGANCWSTVQRLPMDGIYIGKANQNSNYYSGFGTDKLLYPINQPIGNSGIMISALKREVIGGVEHLKVSFKVKKEVVSYGKHDLNRYFRITYAFNELGGATSCYIEQGDDVAKTIMQTCLDVGGEYINQKCKLTGIPTCILSPNPCTGRWSDSGHLPFIKEVGSNPGLTPLNAFTPEATYSHFNLFRCCQSDPPEVTYP
jgi:hypothetical protein